MILLMSPAYKPQSEEIAVMSDHESRAIIHSHISQTVYSPERYLLDMAERNDLFSPLSERNRIFTWAFLRECAHSPGDRRRTDNAGSQPGLRNNAQDCDDSRRTENAGSTPRLRNKVQESPNQCQRNNDTCSDDDIPLLKEMTIDEVVKKRIKEAEEQGEVVELE